MESMNKEDKTAKAKQLHSQGFNCSQSVVMTFAEEAGINPDMAERMSAALGGGVAKMGEICGCVSAMAVLSGFVKENQMADGKVDTMKAHAWTRDLAEKFRNECGDIVCRRLKAPEATTGRQPKPCRELVGIAARLIAEKLNAED